MQTWIEPIPYLNWNGFVDEISDPENNDEVHIIFSGRKIDFQDLQYAIEAQNAKRSEDTRVRYQYEHKKVLDDKILSQNIEEVVRELKSDRRRGHLPAASAPGRECLSDDGRLFPLISRCGS